MLRMLEVWPNFATDERRDLLRTHRGLYDAIINITGARPSSLKFWHYLCADESHNVLMQYLGTNWGIDSFSEFPWIDSEWFHVALV